MKMLFLYLSVCMSSLLIVQPDTSQNPNTNDIPPPGEFIFVKGGSYMQGSDSKDAALDESPVRKTVISNFYMSKYEVTFAEFDAFCEAQDRVKPDDAEWGRKNRPVVNIDWYDAVEYCNWRSEQDGLTPCYTINKDKRDRHNKCPYDTKKWKIDCNWEANGYRLPTEAEWEYAARGGRNAKRTKYSGANSLEDIGWHALNADETNHPVGVKKSNELGIFDLTGNVWEWCWDWYDEEAYKSNSMKDPKGPKSGKLKVMRGGASDTQIKMYLRVTNRGYLHPGVGYPCLGFRLVRKAEADEG